jgi:hypothetical protein
MVFLANSRLSLPLHTQDCSGKRAARQKNTDIGDRESTVGKIHGAEVRKT